MRFFIRILFLFFLLWACNTEDEVTPIIGSEPLSNLLEPDSVKLLTVTVDTSWQTDGSESWIFINNPGGKALTAERIVSGDHLDLKAFISNVPSSVTVSVLQVNHSLNKTLFNFHSYGGIHRGHEWHMAKLAEQKRKPAGPIRITIINAPRPAQNHYQVSDDFGGNSYGFNYSPGVATIDYTLFENVSKIGITVSTVSNENRYLEIKDPSLTDLFQYDFNDFAYLSHQAVVPLPANKGVSATIRGLKDLYYNLDLKNKGIALSAVEKPEGSDKLSLGFNSGFPHYYTQLTVETGQYDYRYEKLGTTPDFSKISVPLSAYSIHGARFSDFSLSGPADYDHLQVIWKWSTPPKESGYEINWIIHCESDKFPHNLSLPEELVEAYPELGIDPETIELLSVQIIRNIDGYRYSDMIGELFNSNRENYLPREYESFMLKY